MDRSQLTDWDNYRVASQAFPEAAERGRLLAAALIADDPIARKRVEDAYGVEFCRANYPEAYKAGFTRMMDRFRSGLRWII